MNYKGYKDLECYQIAKELRIYISELSKKFPASEKFLLTSQIIDCSRSITRNIAEGYGRFTYNDTGFQIDKWLHRIFRPIKKNKYPMK